MGRGPSIGPPARAVIGISAWGTASLRFVWPVDNLSREPNDTAGESLQPLPLNRLPRTSRSLERADEQRQPYAAVCLVAPGVSDAAEHRQLRRSAAYHQLAG